MSDRSKASEIIDPPTIFVLMCGLISLALLTFLFVWNASPAFLNHFRDAAMALSPLLTFLTVVVAVVGWGETARRNGLEARRTARIAGDEARKTEAAKEQHAREGTRRQIRTLLRDAITTIKSYTEHTHYLNRSHDIDEIDRGYQRFIERINQRETAQTLSDLEYDALDAFVSKFRFAIQIARFSARPESADYMHDLVNSFYELLPALNDAVETFGDDNMNEDVFQMMRRAEDLASFTEPARRRTSRTRRRVSREDGGPRSKAEEDTSP